MPKSQPTSKRPAAAHQAAPETVDPRWILSALAFVFGFALLCGYALLCAAFRYTQWEYVLHPTHDLKGTPQAQQLAFTPVRFGVDSTGQPALDGWWIPSDEPTDPTVLMLHSGDGAMSDALPAAVQLHEARLNVLLFDYRGYGHSSGGHPTEAQMEEDAANALTYLTATRNIAPSNILVYGSGLGASLAARLCGEHSNLAGLILENPDGDTTTRVAQDPRTKIVPVHLLFNQTFPLEAPLSKLSTPKLLLSEDSTTPAIFHAAADPKLTVELKSSQDTPAIHTALRRFLDTYVAAHP